jgi:hypothetical protein
MIFEIPVIRAIPEKTADKSSGKGTLTNWRRHAIK